VPSLRKSPLGSRPLRGLHCLIWRALESVALSEFDWRRAARSSRQRPTAAGATSTAWCALLAASRSAAPGPQGGPREPRGALCAPGPDTRPQPVRRGGLAPPSKPRGALCAPLAGRLALAGPAASDPAAAGARASGQQHQRLRAAAQAHPCTRAGGQNISSGQSARVLGGRSPPLRCETSRTCAASWPSWPRGGFAPPYLPNAQASRGSGRARTASGGFAAGRASQVPGALQ
jgi:hypothetical protein